MAVGGAGGLLRPRLGERDLLTDNEYLLLEAIRLTVEYVGLDILHPIEGWSWYDAWRAVDPEGLEAWLDQMPKSAGGRREERPTPDPADDQVDA